MRACERPLPIALSAGARAGGRLRLRLEGEAAGRDRPGRAVGRERAAAARRAAPAKAACRSSELTIPGQVKLDRAAAGRDRPRHDPEHRQARLPADGPPERPVREARRAEAGPAPDPADAVELPGGDVPGVEPARPAAGRGGRGDGLLGELVRSGRSRASPTSRRARCDSRCPAAAGTSTPTTTPSRPASTRGCPRRSGSPASSRPSFRRAGSSRTRFSRDRCPASRSTAGAAACCASGSCSRTARTRRRPSSAARPTSRSSRRAAGSRHTS